MLVVLLAGAAVAGVTSLLGGGSGGAPSSAARQDIPQDYLALYQAAAGSCPGLPWTVLAGIGAVESDHGRNAAISSAGAAGPMQFLPSTWAAYGVDGDGDGQADVHDPADAIYAAAGYLCANGARGGHDIPGAIYAYNHARWYVRAVLAKAAAYAAPTVPAAGKAAAAAVRYAQAQLGTPYRWGGESPAAGFDCSGLVQTAYAAAGIGLPRTAQAQYDTGPRLPPGAPLQPGDLVFFGTPHNVHHVGIVAATNLMIDAPHTGAVVRTESYHWADYLGATRPVAG